MSDMVERVARALAINHGVDPDEEGPGRRHVAERDGIPSILMDHAGPLWEMWMSDARAAMAAMREPTFDMIDDACYSADTARDIYHPDEFGGVTKAHEDFTARYQTAIDAALQEDKP